MHRADPYHDFAMGIGQSPDVQFQPPTVHFVAQVCQSELARSCSVYRLPYLELYSDFDDVRNHTSAAVVR